jgi:hypothetical protein
MRKFFHWLNGDPISNAREAVCEAMRDLSRRRAEADYHRQLQQFHYDEAEATDPWTHPYVFADHLQKSWNHRDDCEVEERRVRTAEAKVNAAKQRLHALQEKK